MRHCKTCNTTKPLSEFAKKGTGHQYTCKECNKTRLKKHYQENKKMYLDNAKRYRVSLNKWYKDYKSTLKCSVCGEDHIAALDFHHENPEEKEFNIPFLISSGFGKSRILKEISKCIILCANCHRKLHYKVTV